MENYKKHDYKVSSISSGQRKVKKKNIFFESWYENTSVVMAEELQ